MKLTIFTAHHKEDGFIEISRKFFTPVHAGKEISDLDLGIIGDNTGDNISSKNKLYSELTVAYWMWKNSDADYIGIMHYRRIFTNKNFYFRTFLLRLNYIMRSFISFLLGVYPNLCYERIIPIRSKRKLYKISRDFKEYIDREVEKYDIFLPKKIKFRYLRMKNQYALSHNNDDYNLFEKITLNKFPFLKESFRKVSNSKSFYVRNMVIMKRDIYNEYHKMLFEIFEEMEKSVNLKIKTDYQKRIYSFLSERFLSIYIDYIRDKVKIKELKTVYIPNL